jgi:hypothetical protein
MNPRRALPTTDDDLRDARTTCVECAMSTAARGDGGEVETG